MSTHTINHRASGIWERRIGDELIVTGLTPNGLAAWVQNPDGTKVKGPLPIRWLTEKDGNHV